VVAVDRVLVAIVVEAEVIVELADVVELEEEEEADVVPVDWLRPLDPPLVVSVEILEIFVWLEMSDVPKRLEPLRLPMPVAEAVARYAESVVQITVVEVRVVVVAPKAFSSLSKGDELATFSISSVMATLTGHEVGPIFRCPPSILCLSFQTRRKLQCQSNECKV
jgi:hypothetical protein